MAAGFAALEGPVVDPGGDLYFSDLKQGTVLRLSPSGHVDTMMTGRYGIGGLCRHGDGGLVVSGPDLAHHVRGKLRTLLTLQETDQKAGARAVAFNDIHPHPEGRVFAGVRRVGPDGAPVPGEVLLVDRDRRFVIVAEDIYPNGMALAANGMRLWCSDTFRRRLVLIEGEWPSRQRSTVGEAKRQVVVPTDSVPGLPDGLALDEQGYAWVAFYRGGCVARFSPAGTLDRVIEVPADKPLSLCFGGPDRSVLYVVTGTSDERPDQSGRVLKTVVDICGAEVGVAKI